MAVEESTPRAASNGRKIEVIIEDHQAKNPLAATVAEKMITQEKVLILTGGRASGPGGRDRLGGAAPQDAVPGRSPVRGHHHRQGHGMGVPPESDRLDLSEAFNKFITEVPGAMPKSVAVVYDNTVFGKTIANATMQFLEVEERADRRATEAYPVNTLDFKPTMTKVKATNPDMRAADRGGDDRRDPPMTRHAKEIGISWRAPTWASAADSASTTSPSSSGRWPRTSYSSAAWSGNPNEELDQDSSTRTSRPSTVSTRTSTRSRATR